MKVLIACEFSGIVREAFKKRGHDAYSCDLLPTEIPSDKHFKQDIRRVLFDKHKWDLMIAHPTCTRLCNAGVRWLSVPPIGKTLQEMQNDLEEAAQFFTLLRDADIGKICIENPVIHKYAKALIPDYQEPTQIIQPWMFGEDASKKTCLWLKGLKPLEPTQIITKDKYSNQTKSGQNNVAPSKDRWKIRSKTYQGIADAMSEQWS